MDSCLPMAAFFDIDGTIAANNEPPLERDVRAIRAFRAAGNRVFLCTGRSMGYLYDAVTNIGWDGIVAAAGAHITLGDEVLYRTCVQPTVLAPLLERFERSDQNLIMETERAMIQLAACKDPWLVKNYPRIYNANEWHQRYGDEIVSKLTVYGFPVPDDVRALLSEQLSLIEHPHYYEAVPRGCSKSAGMRRVLERIGIPREQSLAFGDSANDSDMLAFAGYSVAMGNAIDDVKALADEVTLPHTDGGVAAVLERLLAR